jgi:ATP-binding cassette, subfamily C, bacterial CydC
MRTLRRLVDLAEAPRRRSALVVATGTAAIACGAGLMATAGYLISRAAEHPPILELTVAIVAVRFFGIARPLARYLERLTSHDLAFRTLAKLRVAFYSRIEPLAPAGLSAYRRGDLLDRLVGDVDTLQNLYLRGLAPPLVALATGLLAVGVTAAYLPAAAAILAAGLLAAGVGLPLLSARLGRTAGARQAAVRSELTADLVELLQGAPELVAYGRGQERLARIRETDRALAGLARRDARVAGTGEALLVGIAGATAIGVLAVAVAAAHGGTLDRVLVAMLALLAIASFESVATLPSAARELSSTVAAGRRLFEVTDREPLVRDPAQPLELPRRPAALALEHVTVRYSQHGPPVLDDVSLRIEPGQRMGLVGASGAGKTTVVNLLLRFLDPERGRLTLAGEDLRRYSQEDVRRMIAVAGQDAHLFSTSIRQNVLIGCPGASDARVEDALRRARIWDWVAALPDGVETYVGEAGAQLSGGQRQRVALARALLSEAPVLVLDEPTAHLDSPTAKELMDDVFAAAGSRTVLLITHRPEGLEHVGSIVTLERGRLQAADPHAAQSSAA